MPLSVVLLVRCGEEERRDAPTPYGMIPKIYAENSRCAYGR